MAKLTPEQVAEIRHLHETTNCGYKTLARMFGVCREAIRWHVRDDKGKAAKRRADKKYYASERGKRKKAVRNAERNAIQQWVRIKEGLRIPGGIPEEWEGYVKVAAAQRPDISRRWIWDRIQKGCEITGIPFRRGHPIWRPEIDKIDPSVGYVEENCRLILGALNRAKSDASEEDFQEFLHALTPVLGDTPTHSFPPACA